MLRWVAGLRLESNSGSRMTCIKKKSGSCQMGDQQTSYVGDKKTSTMTEVPKKTIDVRAGSQELDIYSVDNQSSR